MSSAETSTFGCGSPAVVRRRRASSAVAEVTTAHRSGSSDSSSAAAPAISTMPSVRSISSASIRAVSAATSMPGGANSAMTSTVGRPCATARIASASRPVRAANRRQAPSTATLESTSVPSMSNSSTSAGNTTASMSDSQSSGPPRYQAEMNGA